MSIEKISDDLYRLTKTSNLKKGATGKWRIVYPLKDEDGNIHWKNVFLGGTWLNFFTMIIIVSLLMFLSWSYSHDVEACKLMIENPPRCGLVGGFSDSGYIKLNISNFVIKEETNESKFNPSILT